MNKVILKGRLTRDPELKRTNSDIAMCRFSLAVDRRYSKGEERVCDFIDCKAWRQTAEAIAKYLTKGREMLVEGELNIEKWEKDGQKRQTAVVTVQSFEFCGSKEDAPHREQTHEEPKEEAVDLSDFGEVISDGDLPF